MELSEIYSLFRDCGTVATDSRAIKGGEFFIGLKGDNFDGGDYAYVALESGAAYAVVNKSSKAAASGSRFKESGRIIVVDDSLKLLQDLARLHRRSVKVDGNPVVVIGITGTNGKTTTKELLKTVLSTEYKVTATEGNYNNSIGVPLTLLGIKDDTPFAVIEMGASHPNDIMELAAIAEPDYGIITNVGKGHILGFGSFAGVKAAKEEMYASIEARNSNMYTFPGKIFVNQDNPLLVEMASRHPGVEQVLYGVNFQGAKILPSTGENPYLCVQLASGRVVETHLIGAYNADNVMAAIKIGQFFGVNESDALAAISAYIPSNNRSQLTKTEHNTLIVDAYNANPSSMAASLDNFLSMPAVGKVVMLGEMRELGADSVQEHSAVLSRISSALASGVLSAAYLVGAEFRNASTGLSLPSSCRFFADVDALVAELGRENLAGHTILVKGSHGNHMEKVIPAL